MTIQNVLQSSCELGFTHVLKPGPAYLYPHIATLQFHKYRCLGFLISQLFLVLNYSTFYKYISPISLSLSPPMDAKLCEPLIHDETQNGLAPKLEEVESNCHHLNTTSVSFFKTCFNGLNALSGSTFYLCFFIPAKFHCCSHNQKVCIVCFW